MPEKFEGSVPPQEHTEELEQDVEAQESSAESQELTPEQVAQNVGSQESIEKAFSEVEDAYDEHKEELSQENFSETLEGLIGNPEKLAEYINKVIEKFNELSPEYQAEILETIEEKLLGDLEDELAKLEIAKEELLSQEGSLEEKQERLDSLDRKILIIMFKIAIRIIARLLKQLPELLKLFSQDNKKEAN